MANINKLSWSFIDNQTTIYAEHMNGIVSAINSIIDALDENSGSGSQPQEPEPSVTTTYTITVLASPVAGGSVSGGGSYTSGQSVTITANAASGYTFQSWNDGNTNATRTITVSGNATYTATFAANQAPAAQNITFADQATKAIVVGLYDTDNDGEVSTDEAAVEKTITSADGFSGTAITSFNELQNFTNIKISTSAFKDCTSLTSVTFPSPVKFLSSDQFNNCPNLVLTTLPNSVDDEIPARIFYNCANGVNITEIPARFTTIGNSAFYGCRAMPKVKVLATTPPTLGNNLVFKTQTQNSGDNQFADVYVPDASVNTYKAASIWSEFADHIKPLSTWTD